MTRATTAILAALLVMRGLLAAEAAFAEQKQQRQQQQSYGSSDAQQTAEEGAADENEAAETFPVMAVTSVEILRSRVAPTMDVVVVNGVTSADGWSNGELVPLRHGTSSDGVLDLVFVAEPPKESAPPGSYVPIQAIIPLSSGHPFKAVRVRGATNSLLVKDLPGHTEAKPPAEPCKSCIGKMFVAKNGSSSSNAGSDEVVREENLPGNTRVVHQSDGIGDTQHNPNRLTIIIGEDGRIADAAWE
jgi:hypothetical protein